MKIKFLQSMCGPKVTRMIGDVIDIEKNEAKRLIDAGYAVETKEEVTKKEAAVVETVKKSAKDKTQENTEEK